MNNEVVPIGKYKGMPLEHLMADQPYSEWLLAQAWFIDRYADLAQLLRMGRLVEPQDTPDHNAMVAGLIDQRDSVEWLFAQVFGRIENEIWYLARFGQTIEPKGGDILFTLDYQLLVEVKPLIGDDFPTVIRQIKAAPGDHYKRGIVIARKVEATNLTFDQVKRQFELAGVPLFIEADFLNAAANWRDDRADYFKKTTEALRSAISDISLQIDKLPDDNIESDAWGGSAKKRAQDILEKEKCGLEARLERLTTKPRHD